MKLWKGLSTWCRSEGCRDRGLAAKRRLPLSMNGGRRQVAGYSYYLDKAA
jgi:hypothetical protein